MTNCQSFLLRVPLMTRRIIQRVIIPFLYSPFVNVKRGRAFSSVPPLGFKALRGRRKVIENEYNAVLTKVIEVTVNVL